MIAEPLEIFTQIAHIPHSSFQTEEMFDYICAFAKKCGYAVQSDGAKNIHAYTAHKPKLCFQSHYDMVGVGQAHKPLELYEENGFLRAKNSSLGADNGIGVALQLYMMQKYHDLEFLFTNNEEVGLLGARGLELAIRSEQIINLDSETFGQIVLGCAGGYDMHIVFDLPQDMTSYPHSYAISTKGFKGGHSGIDIDKNIKNAIVALMEGIRGIDGGICALSAGEKMNAIPVGASVVLHTHETLQTLYSKLDCEEFLIEELAVCGEVYQKDILVKFVLGLGNGVRYQNSTGVLDSINISLLKQTNAQVKVSLMGRANTQALLDTNLSDTKKLALSLQANAKISIEDFYPPWECSISEGDLLLEQVKKSFAPYAVQICQIHAGLECGILQERLACLGVKNLKILSIGPTIIAPHSLGERLDLEDFKKFFRVLEHLVENYKI
ncbi:hypothetical protein BKH46_05695 [Helicobacter sp. 12S02634-8]|uniref:M20/M25/M40 family metallo-hydrolase n=1 Tax=Helicobacter sp. 12S02634-8 TaxID=1476199 RepID=UPI000BA580A7|nr:M20/M25/M40 family metallo-hydrolase [Helicobacter sp. 12S02634-8]PAF46932.1 hypothetical protein BKH46_05695 [Helicobacter sp. 12S02634-8]